MTLSLDIKNYHAKDAGQTFSWLGEDNEINFKRHLVDPQKHDLLVNSGWTNHAITYKFNSSGFRSVEFDASRPHMCVFGCSFTFGVGINTHQRYGDQLADWLGVECFNFGVSGGSDSTSFRLAASWLGKLKPTLVVYQSTFVERFEIIQDGCANTIGINAALGGPVPIGQGDLYKIWITNNENSQLLALKNRLAMRALCNEYNSRLIEIDMTDFFGKWPTVARDTHHPGEHANRHVFDLIKQQL